MENKIDKPDESPNLLKQFTAARVALGRTGSSVPLRESLAFKLAHAYARDAVYSKLNNGQLLNDLLLFNLPVLQVHSRAKDRYQYLQRPDLGRLLDEQSKEALEIYSNKADMTVIIADGLSADAVNLHAVNLLELLIPKIAASGLRLGPLVLASQGRVALSDEIGHALKSELSLILIGERPGLSSANSMGAYMTYKPRPGLTDESRNCVSNIWPGGLSFHHAAEKIYYLIMQAFKLKLSGVWLKDNAGLLGI